MCQRHSRNPRYGVGRTPGYLPLPTSSKQANKITAGRDRRQEDIQEAANFLKFHESSAATPVKSVWPVLGRGLAPDPLWTTVTTVMQGWQCTCPGLGHSGPAGHSHPPGTAGGGGRHSSWLQTRDRGTPPAPVIPVQAQARASQAVNAGQLSRAQTQHRPREPAANN